MPSGLAWTAEVSDMAGQQPGAAASGAQAPALLRADGTPIRVLVVDDEPSLAELLASVLRYEGWEIQTASDGSGAVRTAREFRPDAVVLDIMLPDFDGLEVLRRVRADLPHVCVLFLTARDAVEDRIAGITAGGDDYVTKPFSLEEVLARLRGLLRRAGITRSRGGTALTVGDLTMDEEAREVRREGELIELTATEFELLRFLMRNPRRVLSKAQILDRVWNYDFGGQAHVVELYISYLRKKVDAGPAGCSRPAYEPARRQPWRDADVRPGPLAGRAHPAGPAHRRPGRSAGGGVRRGRDRHLRRAPEHPPQPDGRPADGGGRAVRPVHGGERRNRARTGGRRAPGDQAGLQQNSRPVSGHVRCQDQERGRHRTGRRAGRVSPVGCRQGRAGRPCTGPAAARAPLHAGPPLPARRLPAERGDWAGRGRADHRPAARRPGVHPAQGGARRTRGVRRRLAAHRGHRDRLRAAVAAAAAPGRGDRHPRHRTPAGER